VSIQGRSTASRDQRWIAERVAHGADRRLARGEQRAGPLRERLQLAARIRPAVDPRAPAGDVGLLLHLAEQRSHDRAPALSA
jgi:hypothetical protein